MPMRMGDGRGGPISEINVTPLVDIMLVLLIIMMLVAPLLDGTPVALPEARHAVPRPDTQRETVVHVTATGEVFVDGVAVAAGDLVGRVAASLDRRAGRVVYLKADRDASYRAVMTVMDRLHDAHVDNVGLITRTPPAPGEPQRGDL
jgi:biopolymer transport protein TolR